MKNKSYYEWIKPEDYFKDLLSLLTVYGKTKILSECNSSFGENESIYAYIFVS